MSDDEILAKLKVIFADTFEINPELVKMESLLFDELDLDSIDAVDLAIKLQTLTGKRIKPADFKTVRTVRDVVVAAQSLLAT